MYQTETEIKEQRGDMMFDWTVLRVAEERKEGVMQSKRAQRLERRLREGDYLVVNFSISTLDECLCNKHVAVNL